MFFLTKQDNTQHYTSKTLNLAQHADLTDYHSFSKVIVISIASKDKHMTRTLNNNTPDKEINQQQQIDYDTAFWTINREPSKKIYPKAEIYEVKNYINTITSSNELANIEFDKNNTLGILHAKVRQQFLTLLERKD